MMCSLFFSFSWSLCTPVWPVGSTMVPFPLYISLFVITRRMLLIDQPHVELEARIILASKPYDQTPLLDWQLSKGRGMVELSSSDAFLHWLIEKWGDMKWYHVRSLDPSRFIAMQDYYYIIWAPSRVVLWIIAKKTDKSMIQDFPTCCLLCISKAIIYWRSHTTTPSCQFCKTGLRLLCRIALIRENCGIMLLSIVHLTYYSYVTCHIMVFGLKQASARRNKKPYILTL